MRELYLKIQKILARKSVQRLLVFFGILLLFGVYEYRTFFGVDSYEWLDGSFEPVSGFLSDSSVETQNDSFSGSLTAEPVVTNTQNNNGEGEAAVSESILSETDLININTADSATLETLKGVGPKIAQKIIDYRTKAGGFDTVDDLINVSGIGEKTLEKLRPFITVK